MARRSNPQLTLSFARPKRKKGGLGLDDYQMLIERLRADANRVARVFKLPGFELDADRADARDRYGLCFSDGRIRVRLVHVRTGRKLKYSALIDTVVHELAHLRYMDHGARWEALYRRMLHWCRAQGIYEPGPVASPGSRAAVHAERNRAARGGGAEQPPRRHHPSTRPAEQLSLFAQRASAELVAQREPLAQGGSSETAGPACSPSLDCVSQARFAQLALAAVLAK